MRFPPGLGKTQWVKSDVAFQLKSGGGGLTALSRPSKYMYFCSKMEQTLEKKNPGSTGFKFKFKLRQKTTPTKPSLVGAYWLASMTSPTT